MILHDKYSMVVYDSADYKWCSKKGRWCHKDDFNFECGKCYRR